MHTLGEVHFDSVVVIDFGERLKSVLTSFMFSDVPSDEVKFFTINHVSYTHLTLQTTPYV